MIAIVGTTLLVLLGLFALVLVAGVAFAITAFWIWMLIDAIRNDRIGGWHRVLWTILIWFTHIIGAAIYFFLGRRASQQAA